MDSTGLHVLWISQVELAIDSYATAHTHDYFHFVCSFYSGTQKPRKIYCDAPGVINPGFRTTDNCWTINVMFQVTDKKLYREIETFPFSEVLFRGDCLTEILRDLIRYAAELNPSPALIDAGFSYYIQLLMQKNSHLFSADEKKSLVEQCATYIDQNYMNAVTLDDVATHVERNRSYVSSVFSNTYGCTLVEYLNSVRIRKACDLIAYSRTPIPDVALMCGFSSVRNFNRVFKSFVGTTAHRYRTSHVVSDLRYDGDLNLLRQVIPSVPMFTYVVDAQKRIDWKSNYEYFLQQTQE